MNSRKFRQVNVKWKKNTVKVLRERKINVDYREIKYLRVEMEMKRNGERNIQEKR